RHRAIDFLRTRKRERELLEEAARETDVSSADDDAAGAVYVSMLERAVAALAPLHREVLLLRHQDDLSYAEIALVVGCSIGTVRSRLHQARRQLHELIEQRGDAT